MTDQLTTKPVPCGKCPECLKRRTSGWSFRLLQEEKTACSAHFITLTYDTQYVPITDRNFKSLDKQDLQKFFKRLRFNHNPTNLPGIPPIRYYAVGEYGGKTMRPHYHIILFNAHITLIQPSWGLGHVHYGKVSGASIGYTLKYVCKPGKVPLHKNDDRQKEFALMSKGLGKNYLTEAMKQWHLNDLEGRMYCNLTDGKKISMPRYFKDKIYSNMERKIVAELLEKKFTADQEKKQIDLEQQGINYWTQVYSGHQAAITKFNHEQKRTEKL